MVESAMRSFARVIAPLLMGMIPFLHCAQTVQATNYYDALDLTETAPFDPNDVISTGAIQDVYSIETAAVQEFLERTSYGRRPSFLATYQSNANRASEAIVRAARINGINPLVILVHAQIEKGLISSQVYPRDPSPARVEYAFDCGCPGTGDCNKAMAGFDRQADCIAKRYRTALDQIAADRKTASGWGPAIESTTLDGVKVTPLNDATAAVYDVLPTVGRGERGVWVFYNVWNMFAATMAYDGPLGGGSGQSWIGDACQTKGSCADQSFTCATDYPGGMCTQSCSQSETCLNVAGKPQSTCIEFGPSKGYCLRLCNPSANDCRTGFACQSALVAGTTKNADVCVKK